MLTNGFKIFDLKNMVLIPIVSIKTMIMLLLYKKFYYQKLKSNNNGSNLRYIYFNIIQKKIFDP